MWWNYDARKEVIQGFHIAAGVAGNQRAPETFSTPCSAAFQARPRLEFLRDGFKVARCALEYGSGGQWAIMAAVILISGVRSNAQPEAPPIELVWISAEPASTGGPDYGFLLGRYEVRNDQFVEFLNAAKAHPDDERGHYLYFDVDSGDAFLHSAEQGAMGTLGAGTVVFRDSANPWVTYHGTTGRYEVSEGYEDHPATGVSWFGALKYCNWLTLESGLPATERVYVEGGSGETSAWRPVTLSDSAWLLRDLNPAERSDLLSMRGFRLPMDGGEEGGDPGPFNEWYQAAAWNPQTKTHHIFGFGRSVIEGTDANFRCSGDPFEDLKDCIVGGTTPVGYYDGFVQDGAYPTRANENPFAVFDLSGNVWEWMQDRSFDPAGKPPVGGDRRNRGGSFRSGSATLAAAIGAERNAASANDSTGFRVVLVQEVAGTLAVIPEADFSAAGIWGGPYELGQDSKSYRVHNVGTDPVAFSASVDAEWLTLSLPPTTSLESGESAAIALTLDPVCQDGMTLGDNLATFTVQDTTEGAASLRRARIAVSEPLELSPADAFSATLPFRGQPTPSERIYALTNHSERGVRWSARIKDISNPPLPPDSENWVTVNGSSDPRGSLRAGATESLLLAPDPEVAAGLPVGTYRAEIAITDDCTGGQFTRTASLTVVAPFSVTPQADGLSRGSCGGPFPDVSFSITNGLSAPVSWAVESSRPDLLSFAVTTGSVPVFGQVSVAARISEVANALVVGRYPVTLTFSQPSTGFAITRTVVIEVASVRVEPESVGTFRGPRAGPFDPQEVDYILRNTGVAELAWSARFTDTSTPPAPEIWLQLSETQGAILNPHGTARITLSPSPAATRLPPGTYTGAVTFLHEGVSGGCPTERNIILLVGREAFALPMALVPPRDVQPNGPTHLFRIARFEVTNGEYARFLNEAYENPASLYGQFLNHGNPPMGIVRLSGDNTLIFDSELGGAIEFSANRYLVRDGKENHPVVGMSWFGALKYCNWMTLVQGMDDPDQRAYLEGSAKEDWAPVSQGREAGPTPTSFLEGVRGFRLPMDGQSNGPALLNEWHKAASRIGVDAAGNALFGAQYGFGRSTLLDADANFASNGDTVAEGPTPIGFFNGVNRMGVSLNPTRDTGNGYGLYDLCGNAAEWIQDAGRMPGERAIRGGHFSNAGSSPFLRTTTRGSLPADAAFAFVGFRVAQSLEAAEPTGDPPGLRVTPTRFWASGWAGGPIDSKGFSVLIENSATHAHDDFTLQFGSDWLEVDGIAPQIVPPHSAIAVPIKVRVTAGSPGVSPPPLGSMAWVSGSDPAQPVAGPSSSPLPDYDFWIGRYEVTNGEYAVFLNDVFSQLRLQPDESMDGRSDHMYFDTDSGSVYLHDRKEGELGAAAPTATVSVKLYDASVGRLRLVGERFVSAAGFEDHPVVGVTWFGAVKYCNWLSLSQGIPSELLGYLEAPSPDWNGWRPNVLQAQGFDRRRWVRESLGYRLPMDEETAGPSTFNEWYKAAAWTAPSPGMLEPAAALAVGATPESYRLFGFGRDSLNPSDANYWHSRDTQTDETTRVGFFDGLQELFHLEQVCHPIVSPDWATSDTDNPFGLYDVCGNVAEWMHDVGDFEDHRATRGGSWRTPSDSPLLTNAGRDSRPASGAFNDTGFRIVRGTGRWTTVTVQDHLADVTHAASFLLDLREPLRMVPPNDVTASLRYGDAAAGLPRPVATYSLTNSSAVAMAWSLRSSQPWLDAEESTSHSSEGSISGGQTLILTVETNSDANSLSPGKHSAIIELLNKTTGQKQDRAFILRIDPPVRFEAQDSDPQEFSSLFGVSVPTPARRTFVLTSEVTFGLHFDITTPAEWLDLEAKDGLSGTLAPRRSSTVRIEPNDQVQGMAVGTHRAILRVAYSDPRNHHAGGAIEREVLLNVMEPLTVSQEWEPWHIGPGLKAGSLPQQIYQLATLGIVPMDVSIDTDQSWLAVEPEFAKVAPGLSAVVTVQLTKQAHELPNGVYSATVFFEDGLTGTIRCRHVELDVEEDFSIEPFEDFQTVGIVGGVVSPRLMSYRITNSAAGGGGPLHWSASVFDPRSGPPRAVDWILLNGASRAGGELLEGETASLMVEIDRSRIEALGPGNYEATLEIADLTHGETAMRQIQLTMVQPTFSLRETDVVIQPLQPGGPAHPIRMGKHHVTNEEFVEFLNDALSHPNHERGQYLYFDTTTGGVFVNSAVVGEIGTGTGGRTVRIFSPSLTGQIVFANGAYEVATSPRDYSHHPVAGVSWYGALKFSNWLTLDQGMPASERCYSEGTDGELSQWHPLSIDTTAWSTRDLNDAERESLVRRFRGYRLPMDDGWANPVAAEDDSDDFNEWFKAAAWMPGSDPPRNTLYGFGRDQLTSTDANFRDSRDAFDNGTTPVDYFEANNDNAFGLSDMSGNLYQWIQDRFSTHPGNLAFRAIRGGSWNDPSNSASLRTDARTFTRPERIDGQIGFRVVRTLVRPNGDFNQDGDVDTDDLADLVAGMSGPAGGVFPAWTAMDFDLDDDVDLQDVAGLQRAFTGGF